uniref:Uncharacterized protein n=1 Tax=Siphoviridae sp. ctJyX12 TaxID=2827840 RepID=A0A8S5SPY1_9CAUD|nr:MAG TPA: hypothetical protein [Siphoviridae sp. ctJyX12]
MKRGMPQRLNRPGQIFSDRKKNRLRHIAPVSRHNHARNTGCVLLAHAASPPSQSTRRDCKMIDPDAASWISYPAGDAPASALAAASSTHLCSASLSIAETESYPSELAIFCISASVNSVSPLNFLANVVRLIPSRFAYSRTEYPPAAILLLSSFCTTFMSVSLVNDPAAGHGFIV